MAGKDKSCCCGRWCLCRRLSQCRDTEKDSTVQTLWIRVESREREDRKSSFRREDPATNLFVAAGMWRWEKVGEEGDVETRRARTEEERERKEGKKTAYGQSRGSARYSSQAVQPSGNHHQRTTRRSDVRSAPPLSSFYRRKIAGLGEASNNLIQSCTPGSKQASITYTVHETQLAPGTGGIDQFRRRCIHSSKHSHVYWGAQQPFLQHAIGTVQYSTPTSNQGSFRVCQFPQCMDRPVQYQGPAARLFVRDPYPDHPIKIRQCSLPNQRRPLCI